MKNKKYRVYLSKEQRKELENINITKRGKQSATIIKRANILLNLDENNGAVQSQEEIAKQLSTSTATIYNISRQFAEEGLAATISRKIRETPPIPKATGDIEAKIIALACSEPPKGRTRWTLRLLEEKVVELQLVDAISDNTIGRRRPTETAECMIALQFLVMNLEHKLRVLFLQIWIWLLSQRFEMVYC